MCEACENTAETARPSPALIARTRAIEATLPGERVDAAAFAVFFGAAGGAIGWGEYQRLLQCRAAAADELAARAVRSFRCEMV
jgi:hypothetical protein